MYVIIEGYSEFSQDVQDLWSDIINQYGFKIKSSTDDEVILENQYCYVYLLLNGGDRVGYLIENKESNLVYDEMSLYMFFNIDFDRTKLGKEEYPISKDEWFNYVGEDNYRAITRIDLPLVQNEVSTHFGSLLNGNFSFEKKYLEWYKWTELEENKRKSMQELSYESYQKTIKK